MGVRNDAGLSTAELAQARGAFAPLLGLLHGQPGAETVLVAFGRDGSRSEIVAARVRRMRRALYPMSGELAALTAGDRSSANDARRRALRAIEYPEGENA